MAYPKNNKKQRITGADSTLAEAATAGDLSTDLIANILGCLHVEDIMRSRGVNKKWKEAVKITIVPLNADFVVMGLRKYNAMAVMTREMPNLQQITVRGLGRGNKWSDGEDPDEEEAARYANWTPHDINIISNFRKLRYLKIDGAYLNGRYPFLFSSFPLLQKLSINRCHYLKWDLEMLAGLPLLKELECYNMDDNECVTGNINSLRALKDTLEKVHIEYCDNVEGNFMDLADFPRLKELKLGGTAVTGDIRDIGCNDFSSLKCLVVPKGVYGGRGYEFQRISDAPDLIRAVYLFKKQRPFLEMKDWYMRLSEDSPDWYEPVDFDDDFILLSIHFVKAGSRIGYQWQTNGQWCEVNWLDPEPDRDSSEYTQYIEELRRMQRKAKLFKGLNQPPTEEEYNRLWEGNVEEIEE